MYIYNARSGNVNEFLESLSSMMNWTEEFYTTYTPMINNMSAQERKIRVDALATFAKKIQDSPSPTRLPIRKRFN